MTTLTASAAQSTYQPREVADGVAVVVSKFTWPATPSAGEVINMVKIPANNTLLDLKLASTCPNAAVGQIVSIGTNGLSGSTSLSYIAANFTASAAGGLFMIPGGVGALPLFCGVSDDSTQQYVIITANTVSAGSGTIGSTLTMIATYGRGGVANS